jgi:hypothetical protein
VRTLIFICLLLSLSAKLSAQGQTRTKRDVSKQYFSNGHLKSVTETRTTLPRYIDPLNFYKKTKVIVTEYDSLSTHKTRQWTRITKIGKDGKPCYEIYFEEIRYDASGNRMTYQSNRCDKRRSTFKQYNDGKLEFIRIQKRRKRR